MNRDLRPLPVIGVTAVLLSTASVLGVVDPPGLPGVGDDRAAPVVAVAPSAGGSVCVTGASDLQPDVDALLLSAPPSGPWSDAGSDDTAPDAEAAARGLLLTLGVPEGSEPRRAVGPTGPGEVERVRVGAGSEGWLWSGWADRPLLVWQEWRTDGGPGVPRGAIASACLPADPPVQTVVGLRTAGGDQALLRLANPFLADATFAVRLVTPTGVVEPVMLRNVSVPAGERVTVLLNDHVPEQTDMAAIVTVGAGRLAVEGLQRSVAELGGVEGVAAVPPVAEPAVAWTLPWVPAGPGVDGAVWVLNPAPRPVTVEVVVHSPQGATVPDGSGSVDVPAGGLVRIDTDELAPGGAAVLGVTLRSTTTGVVVGAGARFRDPEAQRTGLVRVAASPRADGRWAVAGRSAPGRRTTLHIANLSETDVTPRVLLAAVPDDPAVPAASFALTVATIGPGSVGRVVLPLEGELTWPALVEGGPEGRGALVVSRTTLGESALEPVATAAAPSGAWGAVEDPLRGPLTEGWVARSGTSTDGRREVPLLDVIDGDGPPEVPAPGDDAGA